MATVKPFRGLRPPKELVERVESRPYDVLDSEEARAEAGDNAMSLYHIIKPEIDFPVGTSEYDPRVYEQAAKNFEHFQQQGWLVQDADEHYYIYAQTMNGRTQYGLVVGAWVNDYMEGRIKKHELTRRDKEEDRMKHVRVCNANMEPVFFAYPDNSVLNELLMRYAQTTPEYDFVAPIDGFRHQFWVVSDARDMQTITNEFGKMPALYIADGHHRSAAAALVGAEKQQQNPNHEETKHRTTARRHLPLPAAGRAGDPAQRAPRPRGLAPHSRSPRHALLLRRTAAQRHPLRQAHPSRLAAEPHDGTHPARPAPERRGRSPGRARHRFLLSPRPRLFRNTREEDRRATL